MNKARSDIAIFPSQEEGPSNTDKQRDPQVSRGAKYYDETQTKWGRIKDSMITRHLSSNQKTGLAFRTSFGSRGKVKGRVEYVCPYCKGRTEPDFLERTQECGIDQLHSNLQSSSLNTLHLMMKPTWKEQLFISSIVFMELPVWPIGPIMCAQTKPLESSAWGSRRESIKCTIMMNCASRADWSTDFRTFCLAVLCN